jgi:putative transposase
MILVKKGEKKPENAKNMRKLTFKITEFYHVYNRGIDKRVIFASEEDYNRFAAYLYVLNDVHNPRPSNLFVGSRKNTIYKMGRGRPLVAIGAYCLMPNHFHILLTPLAENGVAKFMQKLQTAYAMYFNDKRTRTGRLFEGTFKASHIKSDAELKRTLAHIHLNPAKLFRTDWKDTMGSELQSLVGSALEYRYSSAGEYMTSKPLITTPKHFPKYFTKSFELARLMDYWLVSKSNERTVR